MIGNYRKEVENAVLKVLGTRTQIRVEYVPAQGEKASQKMLDLQAVLGGKIHIDKDEIEAKKEIRKEKAEEAAAAMENTQTSAAPAPLVPEAGDDDDDEDDDE